ncbi:arylsulfatase [Aggregicoccus sp. 17bor-14]|uniref:arylsulfatase n=1 Tax=Myxococcaceae TaxID=31 RepID=UPI00129CEDCF|nr:MULTISPECIES: arylsulfatase [Myxococcaceae]MBF5042882.1 arylsulfatase [Simulacricoccus sp. 17bor-14]MRI88649.1 arylsulfatase [Aggregicoccus sp. 17bor-14]
MAERKSPESYPRPDYRFPRAKIGMTYAQSRPDFPPIQRAPRGAPNIVLVLLDDVGFAWPSTYGGPVRMPTADRLAGGGLTYCQFHVTGLCAPTRAALLTGRNHHSVSTGVVAEMSTGYPGYCGLLPRSCATIGELLSPNGYATAWFGKNHNVPDSHTSAAGPFDYWPMRRGFDYFYGFVGGETDQFYPALFRNTTPVDVPRTPEAGYQLTRDLADDCIGWMRTQKAIAPERPLFVHFAPAAAHGPHQPPLDWRGRNRGRFDMGWDRCREQILARQLELGVVPPGTRLTARPEQLPAWDSFSADHQALLALQMENFADYLEHCDHEVGRLVGALEALAEWDNTLFLYILGDNGSSAEGGLEGTINEGTTMQGLSPPLQQSVPFKDQWGLPGTWPHFAAGWAWAGDTPFQWMKQVASHFGGTRNGMVVSWPAWIADRGARRFQFHHVIDVVPTLLEVVGVEPPERVNGVPQKPIEGVSMAYTFDRANAQAPSRRAVQYFEMMGNRALYLDGWIASCRHGRLPWETSGTADFAKDRWELYRLEDDFSQSEDLAAQLPDKLREMQDQFLVEAAKYDVFPLDDRFSERADVTLRPGHYLGRRELTFYPGMVRLPEGSAPRFSNVDHTLTVHAELPAEGAQGVLMCMGGDMAGWSLFVDEGRLHYHYNWFTLHRYDVVSDEPLPSGRVELRLEFECEDPQARGGPAEVRLFCNGRPVGQGRIEKQVPGRFSESLDVGEDKMSPVYPGYRDRLPFRFTGTLERIDVQLGEAAELTTAELLEEQLHAD